MRRENLSASSLPLNRGRWKMKTLLMTAGLAALAASAAWAETWPARPVTIVVPYSAGGITDLTIRRIEPALEGALDQEVVIFNNTGHSSVGTRRVIDAEPDGYEFLWTETGIMTAQASGITDFGYKDLKPVAAVSNICSVTMMQARDGQSSLKELFDLAKSEDQTLKAGVTLGGLSHMSILALANAADVDVRFIQIGGSADTYAALLGDQIDLSWATPGTAVRNTRDPDGNLLPDVKVRAALYSGPERYEQLPEVPTAHEAGYDVEVCLPHILFAPKETPDAIIAQMSAALDAAYSDNEVRQFMGELGATEFFATGDELSAYLEQQWQLLEPLAIQATQATK